MEKTFIVLAILLINIGAFAQKVDDANVPENVAKTFKDKFSKAEKPSWEMDYDNYVATFILAKAETTASFDKDGNWIKTETPIKTSSLPKAVKGYLNKEFGEISVYKIESAEKTETKEAGTIYYLEVENSSINYTLLISEKGELLKKEIKKEAHKE